MMQRWHLDVGEDAAQGRVLQDRVHALHQIRRVGAVVVRHQSGGAVGPLYGDQEIGYRHLVVRVGADEIARPYRLYIKFHFLILKFIF
jgi:hypothetical protein